jgi:hypothetical protein
MHTRSPARLQARSAIGAIALSRRPGVASPPRTPREPVYWLTFSSTRQYGLRAPPVNDITMANQIAQWAKTFITIDKPVTGLAWRRSAVTSAARQRRETDHQSERRQPHAP